MEPTKWQLELNLTFDEIISIKCVKYIESTEDFIDFPPRFLEVVFTQEFLKYVLQSNVMTRTTVADSTSRSNLTRN